MIRDTTHNAPLGEFLYRKDHGKLIPMGTLLQRDKTPHGALLTFDLKGGQYTMVSGCAAAFWREEGEQVSIGSRVARWLQAQAADLTEQLTLYHAGSDEEHAAETAVEAIRKLAAEARAAPWDVQHA